MVTALSHDTTENLRKGHVLFLGTERGIGKDLWGVPPVLVKVITLFSVTE